MTTSLAPTAGTLPETDRRNGSDSDAEAAATAAIARYHQELVDSVVTHATALLDASSEGSLEGASSARRDLVLYCRGELLPHAIAEEDTIYALARDLPGTGALVDALIAEHRVMAELIDDLAGATTPLGASAAGHALRVLTELHVDKEADYLVPAVAASPDVSLARGLEQMQQQFEELRAASQGGGCGCGGGGCGCGSGGADEAPADSGCGCGGGGCGCGSGGADEAPADSGCGCGGGGCGCGGHDDASVTGAAQHAAGDPTAHPGAAGDARPVLDAREVPHHIRHATVLGALDTVRAGSGLELVAPHDPLPLLAQVEERHPGAFEVSYLERGPEVWRIALDRRESVSA